MNLAVTWGLKVNHNNKEVDTKIKLILTKWERKSRGQEITFQNKN